MTQKMDKQLIRIILADDHELVRAGLHLILSNTGKYAIVAEAGNGKEAIKAVSEFKPDLLILDISMPLVNGTEAIRQVKKCNENTKVLIMTMHRGEEFVRMAMAGGADGYILKSDGLEELEFAIHHVLKGNTYISPEVSHKIVSGFLESTARQLGILGTLTPREQETIRLIAEGMKNKEIADSMSISVKTVEKYRASLKQKLNLHNSAAITSFAIECGVVDG